MNIWEHEKVERKAKTFLFLFLEKCGRPLGWRGVCVGGVLCTNPQEIQSERVEGEDLPQEEGGG